MFRYVLAVPGDNEQLHRKALEAAIKVVEAESQATVYRAYLEKVEERKLEPLPIVVR